MTLTKSQKARRALKKSGAPSSKAKTTPSKSRSAKKGKNTKIQKSIPAAIVRPLPRTGIKGLDSITVEVSQYMAPVNTGIQTNSNVLTQCLLNPSSLFTSGRLGKFAQLYEKYQWEELEFEYLPSSSTQNSGQIFMAIDLDPEDNLGVLSGMGLLNAASSMGSRFTSFPVYGSGRVVAKGKTDFPEPLYIDPDRDGDRWAYSGRFIVGNVSPFPTSISAGYIYMKAKIRFMCPALENASAGGGVYWFMTIRSPDHTYPMGNLGGSSPPVINSTSNVDITYVNTEPGGTTAGSYLVFGDPGVYKINYYMSGTGLSVGGLTFSSDAALATQVPASISTGNPLIGDPVDTHTYLSAWVSVNKAGAWVRYSQSGTHNAALNSHWVDVALTSMPINNPVSTLSLTRQIAALKDKVESLEVGRYSDSLKPKIPPRLEPDLPGSIYSTTFSSSGVSNSWNTNPTTNTASGSGETLEEGPPILSRSSVNCNLILEDLVERFKQQLISSLYNPSPESKSPDQPFSESTDDKKVWSVIER